MPCLIALIILSVLSIFSASHRKLAKEAFQCVFRRVTLRPCDTGFDIKVKALVLGKLINRSPKLAKFVSRRFELLAWIFVIIFTLTSLWTLKGLYNFWAWGDCNGQHTSGGFCAFDPTGENNKTTTIDTGCVDAELAAKALTVKPLQLENYPVQLGHSSSLPQAVFIGCYTCDFTRKVYPLFKELIKSNPANFYFIHFPIKPETKYLMAYDVCVYKEYPDIYWQLVDRFFAESKDTIASEAAVIKILTELGVDAGALNTCVMSETTKEGVGKRYTEIKKTGIYGTPTVFINGTALVGPKPERVYRRLLQGKMF